MAGDFLLTGCEFWRGSNVSVVLTVNTALLGPALLPPQSLAAVRLLQPQPANTVADNSITPVPALAAVWEGIKQECATAAYTQVNVATTLWPGIAWSATYAILGATSSLKRDSRRRWQSCQTQEEDGNHIRLQKKIAIIRNSRRWQSH